MGPRSRDRGNFSFEFRWYDGKLLQWGRDHVIAEIAPIPSYSIFKDLFSRPRGVRRALIVRCWFARVVLP
jgi:hypothetical protein